MGFCPGNGPFDLGSICIRSEWTALPPAALTLAILFVTFVVKLPSPRALTAVWSTLAAPFKTFITLSEAELYNQHEQENGRSTVTVEDKPAPRAFWHAVGISSISLVQSGVWLALGSFRLVTTPGTWSAWFPIVDSIPWLYSTVRPFAKPTATPPFDLFWIFILKFASAVLYFGGAAYDTYLYGLPRPPTAELSISILNAISTILVLGIICTLPLAVPSDSVDKDQIGYRVSPEDYTRLWRWITFTWVYPLVKRGTNTTLNESDVWALSPTIQCRPIFYKFETIKRRSLVRRVFAANSLDILVDFLLTLLSAGFNYAGPFFMKKILDALDKDIPEEREQEISRAYIYAALAFFASVCKGQSDVQHLWFGRRAATRIRSELMAAIYEKALKRKDFSGIVDSKPSESDGNGNGKKDKSKKETKTDENKSGADIGKIVQLMSGDANRIANMISGMYMLYGAPVEIALAMTFLYNLMGVSAFAGVVCLVIGSPLNSFIARRSLRIQKDLLAARDKRMGVVNEVVTSVKFIKFFAWEEKWIGRVDEARKNEIKWLVKARLNSICLSLLWSTVPVLVSISAFTAYVLTGHTLTVSVAFTSIALFQMLRMPLNVVPAWIVMLLQAKVSVDRIDTFLNEPEVDAQVSSLKGDTNALASEDDEMAPLGLKHAYYRWNSTELSKTSIDTSSKKLPDEEETASTAGTESEAVRFELRDISVVFPQGKLTVVTGPTASGKSALMLALLGEMTKIDGELLLEKQPLKRSRFGYQQYISYAAQSPWLQHASIQKNILFGEPMDPVRYDAVLEACALKPDLAIFEDGDETEIGARGVSLSGGQKARVALARAVYARSQYVLLDDPLSAVDSHTARHLFEKLLTGPLMEHRTVVLITHHVELVLPGTHYIVRMLDGRIDQQGVVSELQATGALDYIAHDAQLHVQEERKEEELQKPTADEAAAATTDQTTTESAVKVSPRKLVQDEERQEGAVKWDVYDKYLRASSYWVWGIILSLILLQQGFGALEKLWIKTWGEVYKNLEPTIPDALTYLLPSGVHIDIEGLQTHFTAALPIHISHFIQSGASNSSAAGFDLPSPYVHPMFYVLVYSAIGLGVAAIGVLNSLVSLTGALRASRRLFRELLNNVVYATVRFHDTTPAGRLLNRFSKDIETIDVNLASSLQSVNSSIATFFSSLLIVTIVFPGFLIPAALIGFIYIKLGIGYLNTGRDLRRMESNSRSPVFSGFAELLDGIVTVRAFSAERRFLNSLFTKVDLTTQMWYTFWMTNRWLLLHYDFLGAVSVLATTLLALSGQVVAGFAGLTITSAMSFTSSIYWTCRFWTQLELDLNSVERVVEYLGLPQEPPAVIESSEPPAYWPSSSNDNMLVVKDLVVKYAPELPAVLHGVSFTLKGKERVGLLGRTGSGKSTLAMSILRFVDPTGGSIVIDGLDITKIGLRDLRSRLTFIPQDATLFTGTIRDNLDPFSEYTDAECLDVLARVQMLSQSTHVSQRSSRAPSIHEADTETASSPEVMSDNGASSTAVAVREDDEKVSVTLDTKVSAGGVNFSQGQRQLIAMARALLRNSSMIIMDEATSSIDFNTDAKIQATIRDEFQNSLLLTVAHRLRTVIDYDRLIVLDQGKVVEFDTPYNLIQKEGGVFRNMCLNSGTFQELEAIAMASGK